MVRSSLRVFYLVNSLIAGALTDIMIAFGEINTVSQALVWLAGSVYGRSWSQVFSLIPWIIIFRTGNDRRDCKGCI